MEDRGNDWLARQIREEARVTTEFMKELGNMGRKDDCEAKIIKEKHQEHCDAERIKNISRRASE